MDKNNPPSITRNGVTLTLVPKDFGLKSLNKGKTYFIPPAFKLDDEASVTWRGKDTIEEAIQKSERLIFMDIFTDNIGDDGIFNEAKYLVDCAEFTAGVQSLVDINEKLDELYALQQDRVNSPDFGATEDGTDNTPKTAACVALEEAMSATSREIIPLRTKKVALEARYKAAADKRKAKADSSTTKTPVVA